MSKHAFSLASKIATLDVGDVILLVDEADTAPSKPTLLERHVTGVAVKSPKLVGRKFRTSRSDTLVTGRKHLRTLLVQRIV